MTTERLEYGPSGKKPKMLVLELWGLGDLAIATPFLKASSEKYQVTLLAKPHALELQPEFWPEVKVVPFTAPWTPFTNKYQLLSWPWRELFNLCRALRAEKFDIALSARWDPRDHLLLQSVGAQQQWGFPRLGSGILLSRTFSLPEETQHRYASWRKFAQELGLHLQLPKNTAAHNETILFHTGSSHPVKVWPLDRVHRLIERLRKQNYSVRVMCDANQKDSWVRLGENEPFVAQTIPELLEELKQGRLFIGNDSGPGHLAALCGLPTLTLFGSQFAEAFLPMNSAADYIEGKPCPYKPCYNSCRFSSPHCLIDLTEAEVWVRLQRYLKRHERADANAVT